MNLNKNQNIDKKELLENTWQSVIITLDDGTVAIFTGKAICKRGDARQIVDIRFTEPKPLPDDCSWGSLQID